MSTRIFVHRVIRSLRRRWRELLDRHVRPWPRVLFLYLQHRRDRKPLTSGESCVAVSITTRKDRVNDVYLVFESIAQGSLLPSRAILWIDDEDVYASLPKSLVRLQARGLEVKLCTNFGPHTKYYPYALSVAAHQEPLVTGDDDQLYPGYWLEDLLRARREFPNHVHCHYAKVVQMDGDAVAPYASWPRCRSHEARFNHIALGVSGVIYPPALIDALREAGEAFRECCPKADDVWLHAQTLRAGYRVQQVTEVPKEFLQIPGSQKVALWRVNVGEGANDRQVRSTYTSDNRRVMREDLQFREGSMILHSAERS